MAIYMIWFLATALMIVIVLTVGTLAAADLLPRRRARSSKAPRRRSSPFGQPTEHVAPTTTAAGTRTLLDDEQAHRRG